MSSPIDLIIEMITIVITNTIKTLVNILGLLGEFMASLGFVSKFGPFPFLVSIIVLGVVLLFIGKFFLGSLKTIILLFICGFVILSVIFMLA